MSTSISQYGGGGSSIILSAAIDNIALAQETNTWQTSADTLSETYAGLGDSRATAISLNPKITQVAAWQTNITNAQTTLSVTSTALTQIVSLAQSLSTSLTSVTGTSSETAVGTVVEDAQGLLSELATTLNTTSGSSYVFAGQNSTEAPITDTSTIGDSSIAGSLASAIATAVSGLTATNSSDVLEEATAASDPSSSAAATSVFSSDLSVSATAASDLRSSVVTGESATTVGVVATQASTTSSESSTSTGSPIRDLIRDLMVVSSMSGMSSETSGYTDLVTELNTSLTTTIGQLTDMEAQVGVEQSNLTSRATMLTSVTTMLTDQLGDARDADLAVAATTATTLKTQLSASYSLVADMKGMTLASYL
ncbi:MAG: flagellin [Acetobacter papayae]|uniref:flagellin n=1 Tax=Acetobacter papayae TaxID=1076592 RepID=UPI0039ECC445